MAEAPIPILEMKNVGKTYSQNGRAIEALRGANLSVKKGEFVCLIGASGSGKSTLLRCVNLLEPIDDGMILLDGDDISEPGRDPDPVRRRIGIVFQSFNLFPHMTVAENIDLAPRKVLNLDKAVTRARTFALLDRLGLADKAGEYPDRLSGGQQQRVAIARALANAPRLLLADEPTGNLDPTTSGAVFEGLYALARSQGVAVVIATHNLELASHLDRVLALRDGHLEPRAA